MSFWKDLGNAASGALTGGVGGLITQGIGSIFGDIFGSNSQKKQTELNRQEALWNMENISKPVFEMENEEWNRRFSEQNQEWERQWNMQNEYNSPENQIARMREAGLNPAMLQGDLAAETAAQGAIGNPNVNEAASAMSNPASVFEAEMNKARIENLRMQNQLTEKEVEEKTINNRTLAELNAGRCETQWATIENLAATTENTKANTKLTWTQRKKEKALIQQINEESKNIIEERKEIQQRINESKRRISESYTRENKILSDTEYQNIINRYAAQKEEWAIKQMKSQFNLNETQCKEVIARAKQIFINNDIQEWNFRRTKDKWNEYGQWELSINGARIKAAWKDTPLMQDIDKAQRDWQKCVNEYNAGYWYQNYLINTAAAFIPGANPNTQALNGPSSTPSYMNP